jgi:hypothetical protein
MRLDKINHLIKIEYKGQEYSSNLSSESGLNPIWNWSIDLIVTDPTELVGLFVFRNK